MPKRMSSQSLKRGWFPKVLLSGLVAGSICLPALAGEFTVSPIRIYMKPEDRAVAITFTNEGNEPLVLQADLYYWRQTPDGQENLEMTEDMFLSPPILQLGPKGRQVVRLARLSGAQPTEQLTFRMIAREIVKESPPKAGGQVQVALALSLPIFVTPRTAKSDLACSVLRQDKLAKVLCENTGNAYAQPREFTLTNAKGDTLATLSSAVYILPGIKHVYELPKDAVIPAGAGKLKLSLDDNSKISFDVTIPE